MEHYHPMMKNFTKILQYILTVFMPICLNSNSGLYWISWLNNNLLLNFLNWIFSLFPTSDYSLCALLFPRFYYRLQKRTCLFWTLFRVLRTNSHFLSFHYPIYRSEIYQAFTNGRSDHENGEPLTFVWQNYLFRLPK